MIEELIARIFATRNAAHLEHWRVKSGYTHETLGAFYDDVVGKLDRVVESNIALFGQVSVGTLPAQPKVQNIISHLEDDLLWIGKNRKEIGGKVPAIDNMIQDLEGVYIDALFKLKNLS